MDAAITPADLLDALADNNRLEIVRLLAGGERCVCEVSETLGISNALASHHIKKLREAGMVSTVRKGVWLHCSLNREALLGVADTLRALAETPCAEHSCCGVPLDMKEGALDV
jgi:ArsR family transcriptional regulator